MDDELKFSKATVKSNSVSHLITHYLLIVFRSSVHYDLWLPSIANKTVRSLHLYIHQQYCNISRPTVWKMTTDKNLYSCCFWSVFCASSVQRELGKLKWKAHKPLLCRPASPNQSVITTGLQNKGRWLVVDEVCNRCYSNPFASCKRSKDTARAKNERG